MESEQLSEWENKILKEFNYVLCEICEDRCPPEFEDYIGRTKDIIPKLKERQEEYRQLIDDAIKQHSFLKAKQELLIQSRGEKQRINRLGLYLIRESL